MAEEVFDVPISLGTVATLEQQTSDALAPSHQQARDAVGEAPVKNVDETGWKQAGTRRRLWMAAMATVAYFVIQNRGGAIGLEALLGEAISGIIISDRWSGSNMLPLEQGQVCWADRFRGPRKARSGNGQRRGSGSTPPRKTTDTAESASRPGPVKPISVCPVTGKRSCQPSISRFQKLRPGG